MAMIRPFSLRLVARSGAWSALLLAGLQALSLLWAALTQASDSASTRVAESVSTSLGGTRWILVLTLIAALGLAGAMVGILHSLLRWWAAAPGAAVSGLWADLAWTSTIAGLWFLSRLCATPALLAASLPELRLLSTIAFHASPWMFELVLGALAATAAALGFWRRRPSLRWPRPSRRTWFLLAALGAALALALLVPRGLTRRGDGRTNVLILAADSVRPDHMSGLGYGRPTTPHLDQLAAEGALFDRAMAPLARTTPSWLSILTGRYPHGHGVRHMFPSQGFRPRSLLTLPRSFQTAGYRTEAISDYAGDFLPTFDLGFQRQTVPPPLTLRTVFEAQAIARSPLALAFLGFLPEALRPRAFRYLLNNADPERIADEVIASLRGDQPFFTVAFFSATHVPFASPYPYWRSFVAPGYDGQHRFQYDIAGFSGLTRAYAPLSAADAQHVIALYDGALRAVDSAVGRILTELRRRQLDGSTLVVFLSDHGENLFETGQTTLHGRWFRGGDEANRVPLIMRGPGITAGIRVRDTVSLVDVSPTLGELAGLSSPPSEGRSLASAARGAPLSPTPVFAETGLWLDGGTSMDGLTYPSLTQLLEVDETDPAGQIVLSPRYEDVVVTAKHRALWMDPWKLVYEPLQAGARVRLYDLSKDPGETNDLMKSAPAQGMRLLGWLRTWMSQDRERRLDERGHMTRVGG